MFQGYLDKSLCRLCANVAPGISIFSIQGEQLNLCKKLELCHFPFKVTALDTFPTCICFICIKKLNSFNNFYHTSVGKQVTLKDIVASLDSTACSSTVIEINSSNPDIVDLSQEDEEPDKPTPCAKTKVQKCCDSVNKKIASNLAVVDLSQEEEQGVRESPCTKRQSLQECCDSVDKKIASNLAVVDLSQEEEQGVRESPCTKRQRLQDRVNYSQQKGSDILSFFMNKGISPTILHSVKKNDSLKQMVCHEIDCLVMKNDSEERLDRCRRFNSPPMKDGSQETLPTTVPPSEDNLDKTSSNEIYNASSITNGFNPPSMTNDQTNILQDVRKNSVNQWLATVKTSHDTYDGIDISSDESDNESQTFRLVIDSSCTTDKKVLQIDSVFSLSSIKPPVANLHWPRDSSGLSILSIES